MKNKIFTILVALLLFNLCFVVAQSKQNNYLSENSNTVRVLEQHRNMFENRYNFECLNECNYKEEGEQIMLQVKQQKRFLIFNLNTEENYTLDEDGKIIKARYNIWSRILNRERLRV